MAGWQLDDCTLHALKGLPWRGGGGGAGRGDDSPVLDVATARFGYPVPPGTPQPQKTGIPQRWKVVSLSPILRGARRTPQASAPLSAPWAHLRTLLSLFIFLTLSASFSSFILFLRAPASHPRRLLLFPPPPVPPQSLPSSPSLSPSLFLPSSRTRLVISNKS